jgi:hypothetical protein
MKVENKCPNNNERVKLSGRRNIGRPTKRWAERIGLRPT